MNGVTNLKVFKLKKFKDLEGFIKKPVVDLKYYMPASNFGYISDDKTFGEFELDDEDLEYLYKKYSITELQEKEIEIEEAIKKVSELQSSIKFLKEN